MDSAISSTALCQQAVNVLNQGKLLGNVENEGAVVAPNEYRPVITWGEHHEGGGDSSGINSADLAVCNGRIFANWHGFAALCTDGSVLAWGFSAGGGNIPADVQGKLNSRGVKTIVSSWRSGAAFAAICKDGSVLAWGNSDRTILLFVLIRSVP